MGTGNGIVDYLRAGLRAASMRQAVIANNIANTNTPGYRRRTVEFETVLADAIDSGGTIDLAEVQPRVVQPGTTPVNNAGNDVDMEKEVGELIKNASTYKVYLRLLARAYRKVELAMQQS